MRTTTSVAAGLAFVLIGGAAMAEPKIYAYSGSENFCPDGLQPITISGVICCGTPNQSQTYQQVMAHPAPKVRHSRRISRAADTCEEGVKGCY